GFRPGLEVVRYHEEDPHARADPLAKPGGGFLCAAQLRAARQQLPAIAPRPAVVLSVGQLDVLGAHALGHAEDVLDVIDVETVEHYVENHRIPVLPDERRYVRLQLEGARTAQEVVHLPRTVLERELDVIETRLLQRLQARLRETYPRGDEIDVEAEPMCGRDDRLEIVPGEWFAAREPELHRAQRPCFLENAQPLPGLELAADLREVGRVVAEDTVQRAAVGELEKEPDRRTCRRGGSRRRLAHGRNSTQLCSSASSMNAYTSAESPVAEYARSMSATMSATVRSPSQRVRMAAALWLSHTIPSG